MCVWQYSFYTFNPLKLVLIDNNELTILHMNISNKETQQKHRRFQFLF